MLQFMRASKFPKALLAFAAVSWVASAAAQTGASRYPDKPIRIIVPVGAGGSTDVITRIVTERLAAKLGQTIIVDNKPGAGGIVGTELAAKAAPDGYTLLMGYAAFALSPHLVKTVAYDPRTFVPISQVATQAIAIAAHPSFAPRTPREIVDWTKANPGKLNVGISTTGSSGHVAFEQLRLQTGLDAQGVIYKSAAANMTAVLSSEVPMSFVSVSGALPFQKSGQLRIVATLTDKRTPQTPNVPTFNESGVPGVSKLVSTGWTGLLAPPGTPKPIVDRVYAALVEVLAEPAIIAKLEVVGVNVLGSSPAEFAKEIEAESIEFKTVVERSGMKMR